MSDAAPEPVAAEQAFPGSDRAGWQRLAFPGLDDDLRFAPNLGCFLLRHRGRTVLCDAGIGPGPNAWLGGLRGALPDRLDRLGVRPEEVDLVIFTHLHMDHIGWATLPAPDGARHPMFANADHVVDRTELDFWAADPAAARPHHREAFDAIFRPLIAAGRVQGVAAEEEFAPGIRLMEMAGHTPGHSAIRCDDDPALVVAGDVFHCPGQVERPDWGHRADMDPGRARRTREAFIARAAAEKWHVAAGHFRDGLSLGEIVAEGAGHRFLPKQDGPAGAAR